MKGLFGYEKTGVIIGLLFILGMLYSQEALALKAYEWEGNTSSDWTVAGNWNAEPGTQGALDYVIDANNYGGSALDPVVTGTIPSIAANLDINNGAQLTIDGTIIFTGDVLIRNGSSLVISSGTMTVNDLAMIDDGSSITVDGGALVVNDLGLGNDGGQGNNTDGSPSVVITSGSITCNDLIFDNQSGDTPSLAISGGTLNVNGDIYGNGGNVDITLSGTGVLNAGGDLLLDDSGDTFNISGGSWSLSLTPDFSNGALTLDGPTAQSISCPGDIVVQDLIIDNPNGASLNVGVTVNNSLTLTNGIFDVSSGGMTVQDNAVVTGHSAANYVLGTITKVGDDAFDFPLQSPISISAPSVVTDEFTASYSTTLPPYDVESIVGLERVSGLEYWVLDRTNGSSGVTVTLAWNSSSDVGDPADLRVARWDGAQWVDEGNAGTTGDATAGTITSGTVTNFSPFTLASSSEANPLPIELTKFNGELIDGAVRLTWETATEINNSHFEIQRSVDGEKVEAIAKMPSKAEDGNSTKAIGYSFTDAKPNYGANYYRLKQVDVDGTVEFHKFIFVNNDFQEIVEPTVYPNPTNNDQFTVEINEVHQSAQVNLISISGSTIPVDVVQSGKTYKISSTVPLKPGFYVLKIETLNGTKKRLTTKKVLVK